jgi:hypothetical protein
VVVIVLARERIRSRRPMRVSVWVSVRIHRDAELPEGVVAETEGDHLDHKGDEDRGEADAELENGNIEVAVGVSIEIRIGRNFDDRDWGKGDATYGEGVLRPPIRDASPSRDSAS